MATTADSGDAADMSPDQLQAMVDRLVFTDEALSRPMSLTPVLDPYLLPPPTPASPVVLEHLRCAKWPCALVLTWRAARAPTNLHGRAGTTSISS
ncbi:hypothetical protein [Nocardia asteroides]